jgi:hypothetical protein
MKHLVTRRPFFMIVLCVVSGSVLVHFLAPAGARADQMDPARRYLERVANRSMDDMFRIDIKTITATFDYYPDSHHVICRSRVDFVMREGQSRPLIHFDPAIRSNTVGTMELNGEILDLSDTGDIRILSYADTTQDALEFQRDLPGGVLHSLEISYELPRPEPYPRFSTEVSDLEGRGNEEIFPTINSPQELARHRMTFRVHSDTAFRCIGSGHVARSNAPLQEWTLDTEREIASYTLMFALLPEEDTVFEERRIAGVDVRILAFVGGASVTEAFDRLVPWLTELAVNLGPFPMPRGLSILLVSHGGGMEYYGGTITSMRALEHEVFHMYYGCSTVLATYRDTWLDEAVNMWYEYSMDSSYAPIGEDYTSNIVSGRSAVAVGFDRRAYDEGARMMEAVARELGGREAMIAFLRHVHQQHQFAPFTTWEFVGFLADFSGVDMVERFNGWLYEGGAAPIGRNGESPHAFHAKDLSPPDSIRQKYLSSKGRER